MSNFKIGDRVRFNHPPFRVAYGTIVEHLNYVDQPNSWWVIWDSDGETKICTEDYLTLINETDAAVCVQEAKIKSDGGSSDYYKLEINGNPVEVEDVIYAMVGGDFALGNAIKGLRRMYLDSKGQGKEGIDMQYDANKIKYFVDSFVERFGDK